MNKNNISRRDFLKFLTVSGFALSCGSLPKNLFSSEKNGEKNPVVIIGSGLGGLSAAAYLAKNNIPVTLIEQHFKPGGYATSFSRSGYKFEVSLHALTLTKTSALNKILHELDIADDIEFIDLPELSSIKYKDKETVFPQRNPDAYRDSLIKLFPKESITINNYFSDISKILDEAMIPVNKDSIAERLRFPFTHKRLWALRNKSLSDFLDNYTTNRELRSYLSFMWPYFGLPPSRLSSFYHLVASTFYWKYGGYYIKNSSQTLSSVLTNKIRSNGGKTLFNTKVESINMKNDRVSSVTLDTGVEIETAAIISNANLPATIKMLGKRKNVEKYSIKAKKYLKKTDTFNPSISSFVVWLGLDKDITRTIKNYEIFVMKNGDVEKDYRASLACNPKNSGYLVAIYDNAYKGYSKEGTTTLSISMLSGYEPWKKFEKDYFKGNKKDYYSYKEKITEMLIDEVEKNVIPGLRSMIKVKVASTPLTNISYTGNPAGAMYGWEQSLDNSFIKRVKDETPFHGLYLASAWGGGIGGGFVPCIQSGREAFLSVIKDGHLIDS